jgi:hypothetical protein
MKKMKECIGNRYCRMRSAVKGAAFMVVASVVAVAGFVHLPL